MEVDERTVADLMKLGLTKYEALAYLALVQLGSGTVSDIHRVSGVPTTKLYDVLSRLEVKGWVEVLRERPMKFRARPPDEVLTAAIEEVVRAGEEVKTMLKEVYEKRMEVQRSDVWMVRGLRNVENKMLGMMKRARSSIILTLSKLALDMLDEVSEILTDAYWRGLDVRVLVSGLKKEPDLGGVEVALLKPSSVRPGVAIIYSMVIIDSSELLLVLPMGIGRGRPRDIVGVWVRDESLARLAEEYVDLVLKASKCLGE
ncbi:hypothetical protein DRO32_03335 [Candidatus Bathyarchaeota archaeon]|nr:MAG: hypothetical protein DRO32_03335 [Candidatus Bathyarchaeota archaeon]